VNDVILDTIENQDAKMISSKKGTRAETQVLQLKPQDNNYYYY
jgi:hypothetical protein